MDLLSIMERFPDQEACIEHLEKIRWGKGKPACFHCGSVDGDTHTNTIEGFWSLLKRAWYGQHHHYRVAYTPLYVAEACYKYNYRDVDSIFDKFVNESMII